MKNIRILLFSLSCISLLPANAIEVESDSVRPLSEVVVTGTRSQSDVRHLSQTVQVLDRPEIEHSLQPSLMPLLTKHVPGLFTTSRGVMGYGVSGGSAGAISLRGLSGGSGQMMVLIDGHPQYAGIFGHTISDSYQSLLADKVEVLRGPASVLYGSNAMGGVVNIVTRQMPEDGVSTSLHAGYGSWNTLESELTNRTRFGGFSSVASVSYNRTDGHRPHMGFEQMSGYARVGYDFSANWKAYADLNLTHFNASNPGPDTAPLLQADQHITRGVTSLQISNDYGKTSGALSFFYNWGHHKINDGYCPSKGEHPQQSLFLSDDDMMGVSLYQSGHFLPGNRITLGFDWFRYGGHAWNDFFAGAQAGTTKELTRKHEDEFAGYLDVRQEVMHWLTLNAALRLDHHSQSGTEWVPQFGASLHLPRHIEVKLSAARGFRYPTIKEMYMFPPQNPDLKAESLWNYEIALSQSVMAGRLNYGLNVFYIDAENIILTLPNPNGAGRLNRNSGRLKNCGFELQGDFAINSHWAIEANYSFLHMKTSVIGAPENKLYAGGTFTQGRWRTSTGLQYIAGLYSSTTPEVREHFLLWDATVEFEACKILTLWARGENLLAQEYEINLGFPMPRATAMAGVRLKF